MYCFVNVKGHVAITDIEDLAKNLNATGFRGYYKGKFRNLLIFIKPTGEYNIKGSFWKYALGNNTSRFSYGEFLEVIHELDSLTFGTFSSSYATSTEVGLNVPTTYDPSHYLMSMISSKHKNRGIILNPEFKQNNLWARRSAGTTHCYKCYNKTLESKMPINLLRIEHVIKNMKMNRGRQLKVEEIIQPAFIQEQYGLIRSFVNELAILGKYNPAILESLRPQDKWRYLAYCNSGIDNPRTLLNIMGMDTNTKSREYKKLMRILTGDKENGLKNELIRMVEKEIDSVVF